ncbi:MAG: YhdP family protein [Pseudomonadota bacterium]
MPFVHTLLKFAQRRVVPGLGLLVILMAMLLSLGRLILPWFGEDARAWVERQAFAHGVELTVEQLDLDWEGLGPRLVLREATLFGEAGRTPLRVARLALTLDIPRSLMALEPRFGALQVEGVRMQVLRDRAGRWQFGGFIGDMPGTSEAAPAADAWPRWLEIARRVELTGSQLCLHDDLSGMDLRVDDIQALFEHGLLERRLALRVNLPENLGGRLELRARTPDTRAGMAAPNAEIWLQTSSLQLAGWSDLIASLPRDMLQLPLGKDTLPRFETGEVRGQAWLRLRDGVLVDARARVDLADWRLNSIQALLAGEREVALQTLLDIQLESRQDTWTLDIEARPPGQREASQRFSLERHGARLSMAAERIDLDLLRPWLVAAPLLPEQVRQSLIRSRPTGSVHDLRIQMEFDDGIPRPAQAHGQARFERIGWSGHGYLPSVANLGGELWLNGQAALMRLDSPDLRVDLHEKIREVMHFDQAQGDLAAFWADIPMLALRELRLINDDLEVDLDLRLDLSPGGERLIDATGGLRNVRANRVPAYLPVAELGKEALDWLDHTMPQSGGKVPQGAIRLHGDLRQFPYYDDGSGHFEVRFPFHDLKLDFAPGWRHAERLHGELAFINNGLSGRIDGGSILDVPLREGWLSMPDFDQPRLNLRLALDGNVESMLEVLKSSPLIPDRKDLDQIMLSGPSALRVQAEVRLDRTDPSPSLAEGWLDLHDARLSGFEQQFENIRGTLHFIDDALDAQNLHARYRGQEARLAVSTDTRARKPAYRIDMDTHTRASDWLPKVSHWNERIHGLFPLRASLFLGASGPAGREVRLELSSDLHGLVIDLPAPYGKTADATQTTEAALGWKQARLDTLQVRQPERFDARLRMNGQSVRSGILQLGGDDARWPSITDKTLRIEGHQAAFNLEAWRAVFSSQGNEPDDTLPTTLEFKARADTLHALGGDWESVQAEGRHDPSGWRVDIQSPRLEGKIVIPALPTPAEPLSLELNRLVFAGEDESDRGERKTGDAPPSDPTSLPPLRVRIAHLVHGDIRLQDVHLRGLPQPRGLLLQELRASTPHLVMRGDGSWMLGDAGGQMTRINLGLESKDVGAALAELGFRKALRRGRLENTQFRLRWADAPDRFDWALLEGEGTLDVREGSIENVEPGAGRVLGLLSIAELPRRLTLDFGDVFGAGLRFERIHSPVRFHAGRMETNPMELSGPSAQIIMRGYSDMRNKTLHYDMVVAPALGNVLPIIGTVAGGPLIGGAVFLAQKVFDQFGGGQSGFNYRITGSWDEPRVDKAEALERPMP